MHRKNSMNHPTTGVKRICAYCGSDDRQLTRDYVIPASLYSPTAHSSVQRLTVAACIQCNHSWSDDEAHFRNVLTLAGPANSAASELWNTKVRPSFHEVDGRRRFLDLWENMKAMQIDDRERHLIFPGNDQRFLRVLRKIVRGLSFYELSHQVADDMVHVDLLRWDVPEEFTDAMPINHRGRDVFEYQFETFEALDDIPVYSAWLLRFFETRRFIGCVWKPKVLPSHKN
jgi:hypothetical protein